MTFGFGHGRVWAAFGSIVVGTTVGILGLGLGERSLAQENQVVTIGFQKSGNLLFLKADGGLEERLEELGFGINWVEFSSGPPLLEGLNVGDVDFGHSGDAPPIFAQAADAPLIYVASTQPSPASVAVLLPAGSTLESVEDLEGKKVAFARGSSAHYFIVEALASAGLSLSDIEEVYLSPADARTAFEGGNVDAWAIWDPFFAAAELGGATVLVNGEDLTPFREYYFASEQFVEAQPELIEIIVEELDRVTTAVLEEDPGDVAARLSPELGVPADVLELSFERRTRYGAVWIEPEIVAEQQTIADTFIEIGILPKTIQVSDRVWTPD